MLQVVFESKGILNDANTLLGAELVELQLRGAPNLTMLTGEKPKLKFLDLSGAINLTDKAFDEGTS